MAPEDWRDWAGLPEDVLGKVASTLVAQDEAAQLAYLREKWWATHSSNMEEMVQEFMAGQKRKGNCLFVFARVCKGWRKAQLKVGGPLCTRVKGVVIEPGSVALAKWALAEGCPRDNGFQLEPTTMAHVAARQGHRELVQWLVQEQGFAMDKRVMKNAAFGGNLELVQWLYGKGSFTLDCEVVHEAAHSGNVELAQWLRGEGGEWRAGFCFSAARSGRLEMLRWARENGCDWNEMTCAGAAQGGHLEVLQWLRANGCPWNRETTHSAVWCNQFEVLRWAHENGCERDEHACANAFLGGHLEMLQWLRAHGYPWEAWTRDRAADELGYTDDFGNLIDDLEYYGGYSDEYSDDELSDGYSDEDPDV